MLHLLLVGCGGSLNALNTADGPAPTDCADPVRLYVDEDGDGFGAAEGDEVGCAAPGGFATKDGDCDDTDDTVFPDAEETCDGIDENCDGQIDEAFGRTAFYLDADGDGFGDDATQVLACAAPPDHILEGDDCDDSTELVNPDAPEVCDGQDNDCNDLSDEDDPGLDLETRVSFYGDDDGDGYGEVDDVVLACSAGPGFSEYGDDCDDTDPAVNPGATEVCSGRDDNCDSLIDDADPAIDPSSQTESYADTDADGLGDPYDMLLACVVPPDRVDNADDCDDSDPAIGGPEDWYADSDGDGYGAGPSLGVSCNGGAGSAPASAGLDCDDTDPQTSPGGFEICEDGIDQDCNGVDAVCAQSYFIGNIGLSTLYSQPFYLRGNRMHVPATVYLDSFSMYLGLSTACFLDYYVQTSAFPTGPWTPVWSGTQVHGPGTAYFASPPIGITVTGGQYVALSVGWNCTATYYADYGTTPLADVGIGTFQGTVWDNGYPGYSALYVPPSSGTLTTLSYAMEVVVSQ